MMVIVMLSWGPLAGSLAGCGEGALDSPKEGRSCSSSQTIALAWRRISPRVGWCARGAGGGFWVGGDALGGGRCGLWRGVRWLRPRRGRCREVACGATHVLLADVCLLRRCDSVEVIGAAVLAATDAGYRRVAEQLDRPAETVRDWLSRFRARAELVAAHFCGWARALDGALLLPNAVDSPLLDAVEAIGVCTRAASLWLAHRPAWSWVSALTGGRLLWINTNPPWPSPE